MRLARFIGPLDLRTVAAYLLAVSRLLAAILLIPFAASLLYREFTYSAILGSEALVAYLLSFFGRRPESSRLELPEALAVVSLTYLAFSLTGAFAFLPAVPFLDGFFESMSGFTTTGLTVVSLKDLPGSLIFFRAYAQWIGGAGIAVLSLVLLLGPGKGSLKLLSSESGQENIAGDVIATSRVVMKIYAVLTAAGFVAFFATGMSPAGALMNIFTTVSTGGFSSVPGSVSGAPAEAMVILFMVLGASGFQTFYSAWTEGTGRLFADNQIRLLVALPFLFAVLLLFSPGPASDGFSTSLFNLASALTTTGFSLTSVRNWSDAARLTALGFMIIGGASGSTAGGLKIVRLIIMLKLARWFVIRNLLPQEAKLPLKEGGNVISDRDIKLIFSFFGIYMTLIFVSALVLVFYGFNFFEALFESASGLGTVGLSSGVTSAGLAAGAKLMLIFDMWAGRLEILPILVLFYMSFHTAWRMGNEGGGGRSWGNR